MEYGVAFTSGFVVGPVPEEVLREALALLGWREGGTTELRLQAGWILCDLDAAAALGLGRALALSGGRTTHVIGWTNEAGVDDDGDAQLQCTLAATDVSPDGAWSHREPHVEDVNYGREWGTREDAMWALAEQEGNQPEDIGAAYADPLPDEARFGPLVVRVDIPGGWRLPSAGPTALVHVASTAHPIDADELLAGLAQLRREDRLDERRPPDLALWARRALRRAGLHAVPTPGDPRWTAFNDTFTALTRRATRTPPGQLPAWLLTEAGRRTITGDEAMLLACVRAFPGGAREALRGGARELEIVPATMFDDVPPWA